MINVAIIGATGYTGEELVRILAGHRDVKLKALSAIVDKPRKISEIFPALAGKVDLICKQHDAQEIIPSCDIVFLALPHRVSMEFAPKFLASGKKVIDLSADYRLPAKTYKEWYGVEHRDKDNLKIAVYGMPELYRERIKKATLLANPGCYPTSVVLAAAPAIKAKLVEPEIIADSKSGVTGAGRKADLSLSFGEVNENMRAYKLNTHQHKPEINQELSALAETDLDVVFSPHLVPLSRGILSTLYFKLKKKSKLPDLIAHYKKFYKDEPFLKVMDAGLPQIKDVVCTNFCSIGMNIVDQRLIVVSCIDNLTKGAAGQAVQNMNIMCGFDEREGLV